MSAKKPTMDFWKKCQQMHWTSHCVSCSTRSHHPQCFHPATLIVITSSARSWYQTEIRPWVIGVGNSSILGKVNITTKRKQKNSCWMLAARCFFTNTKSSCGCWANNIHFINKNPSSDLICHDAMQFNVLKGNDFNAAGYMKICRGLISKLSDISKGLRATSKKDSDSTISDASFKWWQY